MINKGWLVDYNIGEEKQYLRGAVVLRYEIQIEPMRDP